MNKLPESGLVIAISTALLYTWSTAYHQGYLRTARLDSDVLDRNVHQVLYNGFLLAFGPVFLVIVAVTFALFLYSHVVLPGFVGYTKKGFDARRRVVKLKRFFLGRNKDSSAEKRAKKLFTNTLFLAFFAISYILSLAYFEHEGKSKASAVLKDHVTGKSSPFSMVKVNVGKDQKELRMLACGARNCAGIEKGTNVIFYFNQSPGYSFSYPSDSVAKTSN